MQIWIIPHEVIWIVTGQYPYSIPTSILTCSKKLTVFFPFFLSLWSLGKKMFCLDLSSQALNS